MNKLLLYQFDFWSDMFSICERIKKGTFRPCVKTIPCSTITGALISHLEETIDQLRGNIYATGFLEKDYLERIEENRRFIVYSLRDSVCGPAKIPITMEYLINARGKVYIFIEESYEYLLKPEFNLRIGAMKSKGFGECRLFNRKKINLSEIKEGILRTRIYDDNDFKKIFKIEEINPVYGYLFKPTSITDGFYARSLFEGSRVKAYEFLVEV